MIEKIPDKEPRMFFKIRQNANRSEKIEKENVLMILFLPRGFEVCTCSPTDLM